MDSPLTNYIASTHCDGDVSYLSDPTALPVEDYIQREYCRVRSVKPG